MAAKKLETLNQVNERRPKPPWNTAERPMTRWLEELCSVISTCIPPRRDVSWPIAIQLPKDHIEQLRCEFDDRHRETGFLFYGIEIVERGADVLLASARREKEIDEEEKRALTEEIERLRAQYLELNRALDDGGGRA